jgi:hypothetical protein
VSTDTEPPVLLESSIRVYQRCSELTLDLHRLATVFTTMHRLYGYGVIHVEKSIFNSNFRNATGYLGFSSLPVGQLQPASATDHSAFGAAPDARCREYSLSGAVEKRIETGFDQVCKMVVESAKAVAGHKENDAALVQLVVRLILKPGMWFWGINTSSGKEDIIEGCKKVIENELVAKMSQVSVD